jgi:hypothetical protein
MSTNFSYTYPFEPIYCKGDDLSHAIIKPTIIYEEIAGTRIEIPDMPAYKTQDDIGDCRAFSLGVLLQNYTCRKWKSDIPDCKNPPADSAISYFGLMAYTNIVPYTTEELQELKMEGFSEEGLIRAGAGNTFQPNQKGARGMNEIIDDLSKNGSRLILESCRSSDAFAKSFSSSGQKGLDKRDEFFTYLKGIYERLKNTNANNIKDCSAEVSKLNNYVDLKFNQTTLKKALTKNNFDQFLYTLFFDECEKEQFPAGFSPQAYPADYMNVTPNDIKNQIIDGLRIGKPVLFPSLCVSKDQGDACSMSHSLVISGYKKVKDGSSKKDVFKLHNSWGPEWQKKNNDGWVDADVFCHNTVRTSSDNGYRIDSGSVIWIDP